MEYNEIFGLRTSVVWPDQLWQHTWSHPDHLCCHKWSTQNINGPGQKIDAKQYKQYSYKRSYALTTTELAKLIP